MTTVNVTVCDCALVVNETLVSSALKLVIDGSTLSDFLIVNVIFEVLVLPAASVAVAVKVSLLSP